MTRQQLKNSGKLMKKSCMPKNDVTEGRDNINIITINIIEHDISRSTQT